METPIKPLIFQEGSFRARKIKKTRSEKIDYISRYGTFYPPSLKISHIISKKKIYYISGRNLQSPKN